MRVNFSVQQTAHKCGIIQAYDPQGKQHLSLNTLEHQVSVSGIW
jgi:hypothetical protein